MPHLLQSSYQELLESDSESHHERLSYTKTQRENKDGREENDYNTIMSLLYNTVWLIEKNDDKFIMKNKKQIIETLQVLINTVNLNDSYKISAIKKIYNSISWLQGIKRNLMLQTYGAIVYKTINNKPIIIDGIKWPQTNEIERLRSLWIPKDIDISDKKERETQYKDIATERVYQFEEKYTKLSDDDFYTEFSDTFFYQWAVGNCYFLAALRWLMENQYYSLLIKTSVSKEYIIWFDGKRKEVYKVHIPLGEPWAPQYTIYPEDLWHWVIWSLWVQVLEAAYMKHVTWDNQINSSTITKMRWWYAIKAMETICGKENISTWYKRRNKTIKNSLLQFDPQNTIICMSSIGQWWKIDSNSYYIKWYPEYSFICSHSYSVLQVDKTWSTINNVMISDPYDAWNTYRIPYDVFRNAFDGMNKWSINNSLIFNDSTKKNTTLPKDNKRKK